MTKPALKQRPEEWQYNVATLFGWRLIGWGMFFTNDYQQLGILERSPRGPFVRIDLHKDQDHWIEILSERKHL